MLAGLAVMVRPVIVSSDDKIGVLVILRWQRGTIAFVNSVTHKPVTISFRIKGRFEHFSVATDEVTEAYYTGGLYAMGSALAEESTDVLRFCSIRGIDLKLGWHDFHVKNGCLEVKLLWTM